MSFGEGSFQALAEDGVDADRGGGGTLREDRGSDLSDVGGGEAFEADVADGGDDPGRDGGTVGGVAVLADLADPDLQPLLGPGFDGDGALGALGRDAGAGDLPLLVAQLAEGFAFGASRDGDAPAGAFRGPAGFDRAPPAAVACLVDGAGSFPPCPHMLSSRKW